MSKNKKLRLLSLPKTEIVKLNFACPASLKTDLDRYATMLIHHWMHLWRWIEGSGKDKLSRSNRIQAEFYNVWGRLVQQQYLLRLKSAVASHVLR